jgi:hypothetical protein
MEINDISKLEKDPNVEQKSPESPERKPDALDKLDEIKKGSAMFSRNRVEDVDRVARYLGTANKEELNAVKKKLEELEGKKQEAINSSKQEIEKINSWLDGAKPEEIATVKEEMDKIEKQKQGTKESGEKNVEKTSEKPLEVGDEVFKDGKFYKVSDFESTSGVSDLDIKNEFYKEKSNGKIGSEQLSEFTAKKRKNLEKEGLTPTRRVKALLEGSDGYETFDESEVVKVTSLEQKIKLRNMQKDRAKGEIKAAKWMGMGGTARFVQGVTEQKETWEEKRFRMAENIKKKKDLKTQAKEGKAGEKTNYKLAA